MPENNRKKILYLITKSNFGGAQRYVYDLATHMPTDQFEVTVASGGEGTLTKKLTAAKVRTISIPSLGRDIKLWKDIAVFFALIKLFRDERPDIIHLNSSKIGGLGALAGRIARVPRIIFTVHGWAFNEAINPLSKIIRRFIQLLTVHLSHTTITVAQHDQNQVRSSKITTIYNGIQAITAEEKQAARTKLLGEDAVHFTNTIWIGTIAELHDNKGLNYAIKALAGLVERMPDIIYVVIGEGEERKRLQQLILTQKLKDHVFLVGYKDNAATLLSAFDIFLLPSVKEGLPYVMLEAGSVGLPTIASNVGGIPEIITHKKEGLLVSPKNRRAISQALTSFITNPDQTDEWSSNLRRKIKKTFSLESMVKKTIEVYLKS